MIRFPKLYLKNGASRLNLRKTALSFLSRVIDLLMDMIMKQTIKLLMNFMGFVTLLIVHSLALFT